MRKSLKTKIIGAALALFLIGILIMIYMVNDQVKKLSQERVIDSSESLAEQTAFTVDNFIDQYTKGITTIAKSETIANYTGRDGKVVTEAQLLDMLKDNLETYSDAVALYYATPDKSTILYPEADLTGYDPTSREWYQNAIAAPGVIQWSAPYTDATSGNFMITGSYAIEESGGIKGVAAIDLELTALNALLTSTTVPYDGFTALYDQEGTAISHPTKAGENLMDVSYIKPMYEKDSGDLEFTDEKGTKTVAVYSTVPEFGWKVRTVYEQDKQMGMATKLRNAIFVISLITLVIVAVGLYFIIGRMLKPIGRLRKLMDEVSEGDLTVQSDIRSKDEIGQLSDNFNGMISNMHSIISVVNSSADNVRTNSENLSAVAEETNASSSEVAHAVNEIAEGASKSAEDAETVSERADELGRQINGITERAVSMNEIAVRTGDMNSNGQTQMAQLQETFQSSGMNLKSMNEAIVTLGEKVKAIGGVMDTITDISSQTNLLALNASIEAARPESTEKGLQS